MWACSWYSIISMNENVSPTLIFTNNYYDHRLWSSRACWALHLYRKPYHFWRAGEVSVHIYGAHLAFSNLCHLSCTRNVHLLRKRLILCHSECPGFLYSWIEWYTKVSDIHKLRACDHRCLRSFPLAWRNCKVSSDEVRCGVLGKNRTLADEDMNLHRLG